MLVYYNGVPFELSSGRGPVIKSTASDDTITGIRQQQYMIYARVNIATAIQLVAEPSLQWS